MPKVKNPLFSQEARGGIGGLVYNTWRGINTVKTNTSPTGQGTPLRLAAQALLATTSRGWQSLTDLQRASWNQFAIDHPETDWTGSPKRITGMNAYVRLNTNLARTGSAGVTAPPSGSAPAAPEGLALSIVTSDLHIAWTAPVAAGNFVETRIAGPLSPGVQAKFEQTHFLVMDASDDGAAHEIVATPGEGRWTAFSRVIDATTGLASTWVSTFLDAS